MGTNNAKWLLAGAALLALAASAQADRVRNSSCLYGGGAISCTTIWRDTDFQRNALEGRSPEEIQAAAERERKWVARCRPVSRQDDYGVKRYYYAQPGCEFGKYE